MFRFTGISAYFSHFRAVSAGAIVLATILSCSDSTFPTEGLDGVIRVRVNAVGPVLSDSAKEAMMLAESQSESAFLSVPMTPLSRNVLASASAALSSAGCGSGGGEFLGYVKSKVAFAPEQIPVYAPYPVDDDQWMPDMPIGFNFSFYGQSYNTVNIYANGFLQFGPAPALLSPGYPNGGFIPSTSSPNNVLAFGWSDWSPQLVQDGIRYETRGTAPKRKYILQFNNVPEYASGQTASALKANWGRLMVQVVLSEGSNDITIYTSKMSLMNSGHKYTQGIENAAGTDALFDVIQNPTTLVWSNRVAKFFSKISLTDDAVQFSPIASAVTKDLEAPSITAPANIDDKGNDPGLASAVVAVGSPVASDNCTDVTVSSVRSDADAIDAPYPVGTTTITWTAKDAAGNTASATQSVTVLDKEAPVFPLSAQSILTFNATSPSGAAVTYAVDATDNVGVTSIACSPASGSVFRVGSHEVSCSASDAAGNSSSKSFSVSVIGAHEQIANLMEFVKNLGLPNGTANPLINQLKSAYQEQGNECKKVSDFIGMVSKKSSDIDPDDAADMTVEANRIMGALGCTLGSAASRFRTAQAN
jgi:hypothetical protein